MNFNSFSRLFFSWKNLPLLPLRDEPQSGTHGRVLLSVEVKFYTRQMSKKLKITNAQRVRAPFERISLFDPSLTMEGFVLISELDDPFLSKDHFHRETNECKILFPYGTPGLRNSIFELCSIWILKHDNI